MAAIEFCDPSMETLYQELLSEFPKVTPEAIEAALQFMRLATNMHLRQEALFSQYGLTTGRFSLLMFLRKEPSGQLSPSELAKRANVTRATMTQFVDALEKEGFIQRIDDPNDRRSHFVRITPKAENVLKKVLPEHLQRLVEVTERLSRAERKTLFILMDKLCRE